MKGYKINACFWLWLIGFIVALILFVTSCRTPKTDTKHKIVENTQTNDSLLLIEKETVKPLKVPPSAANLNLNIGNLTGLPVGAKYTEKQGQATVTVEKTDDDEYRITANCDSLTLLVTEKETFIQHLQGRVKELEETKQETTIQVVREPKPVQWFFIYSGYLFWGLVVIGVLKFIIKKQWLKF